jgi:hypothetical protein
MAGTATLSVQAQAERLQGGRDGFQTVDVIATGVQRGFFDPLAAQPQGLTAAAGAQRTACHAPSVAIWCASAYRCQLLDMAHGRDVLAPHLDSLLAGCTHPASQAVLFLNAVRNAGPRLARYADELQRGTPGSHAEAYDTHPTRPEPPRHQEVLHQRLWREEMQPRGPALDAALRHGGRILDVSGGPRLMLVELAADDPAATCVGLDVVEVGGLETARRLIHTCGFAERMQVQRLPAEQMSYAKVFDGGRITRIFHAIPLEVRAALLCACYRALQRPGVLLHLDVAAPDTLEE